MGIEEAILDYVKTEGIELGIEKGIEKGIEQGIEQEAARVIILLMKKGRSIEEIQELTGYSSELIFKFKSSKN